MSSAVYITGISKFLPNEPVGNDEMETYLGMVNGQPSRSKRIVLRNNGIKSRYYALDKNRKSTHTNAQMAAAAVSGLLNEDEAKGSIQLLACGTTSADQILPSHGVMVHGELGGGSFEVVSTTGACCAGMAAMKYAWLSVLSGTTQNAVCVGSERLSSWMIAEKFQKEIDMSEQLSANPILAFEKDFLRWMLSDGAGAFMLRDKPSTQGISYRIEWIDMVSYANETETCMYAGGKKSADGKLISWLEFEPEAWLADSMFSLRQDTKLLDTYIARLGVRRLKELCASGKLDLAKINHFLPHLSSEYFGKRSAEELAAAGMDLPQEKWFTNLTWVGNVGAASIYIILEELSRARKVESGDQILLFVPESARFSYAYALLTAV